MRYEDAITCPYCGHKGKNYGFLKEWDYTYLHVNYLQCPLCNEKFRMNWGTKENGTKLIYTIPRSMIKSQ